MRTRRGSRPAATIVVGAVLAWAAGCSTGGTGPPLAPRPVTAAERALLDRAEAILTRACMARHGFAVWIPTVEALPDDRQFPYVVDDVRWARRHGYGSDVRRHMLRIKRRDPNTRYFARLSPTRRAEAVRTLNGGRPTGLAVRLPDGTVVQRSGRGCTSEAEQRLYGDLGSWFRASRIDRSLPSVAAALVMEDPRFLAATSRWARCIRTLGLVATSPGALRAALPERASRTQEIHFAVAEATCANRTPLARTARALDRRYLGQVRAEYRSDVGTARRLQLAALPRARSIVGREPG